MKTIEIYIKPFLPGRVWVGLLCFMLFAFSLLPQKAIAQDQDIMQLILDIEKLTQFKAILSDMQQGYSILTQGYQQVKNLSQGNFNLHSVFLNGLLQVNPEVAKYARVADIIADEVSILTEYKKLIGNFKTAGVSTQVNWIIWLRFMTGLPAQHSMT